VRVRYTLLSLLAALSLYSGPSSSGLTDPYDVRSIMVSFATRTATLSPFRNAPTRSSLALLPFVG
jgi:hypothetical protein